VHDFIASQAKRAFIGESLEIAQRKMAIRREEIFDQPLYLLPRLDTVGFENGEAFLENGFVLLFVYLIIHDTLRNDQKSVPHDASSRMNAWRPPPRFRAPAARR
jgi:hypothetical protein